MTRSLAMRGRMRCCSSPAALFLHWIECTHDTLAVIVRSYWHWRIFNLAEEIPAMQKLLRAKVTRIIHLSRLFDFILWDGGGIRNISNAGAHPIALERCLKGIKMLSTWRRWLFTTIILDYRACTNKRILVCLQVMGKSLLSLKDSWVLRTALHVGFAIYLVDSHMLCWKLVRCHWLRYWLVHSTLQSNHGGALLISWTPLFRFKN